METWLDVATSLIKPFEGCHIVGKDGLVHPYLDKLAKPNVWTRGYGRTYGITENSSAISKEECLEELKIGVKRYGFEILKLAPVLVDYDYCLSACTSWAWNCGVGAFKISRLRRAINALDFNYASECIKTPVTAGGKVYKGLVRRRNAEFELFVKGVQIGRIEK